MCLLPVTELLDLTKVHPFFSSVLAKTLISQVVPLWCQTASDTLSKAVGIMLTQVLTLCSLVRHFIIGTLCYVAGPTAQQVYLTK